jgi:dipeptidyl aminopeptidase/acylaminoacyl peptidase
MGISIWAVGLADEPAETWQPKHVARLKSVVSCAISPDGKYMAYGLAVQRQPFQDDDGPAWTELHVVDAEGQSRPFVTGKVSVNDIQWTPDGRRIAFLSKRNDDKHTCLYEIAVDGGEARRVLQHEAAIAGYRYDPSGKQLAILATRNTTKQEQESRDKGFDQQIYEEDSPNTLVWIVSADGSAPARALELPGSASSAAWSPSGRELVVVLAPTPSVDDSYMFKRVHIVDVDSGRIIASVGNPGKLGQVGWSPDGRCLAMISGADLYDPAEGRLMLARANAPEDLRELMPDYDAHVTSFVWTNDESIVWVADEGENTTLGQVSLEGKVQRLVSGGRPISSILSASKVGQDNEETKFALVGHSPEHPPEVFRWTGTSEAPKRLTDSNPWTKTARFASQEAMTWTAKDGTKLGGILVKPLNYVKGRRYPLIMVVHGGPEAHVPNGWVTSYSNPGQMGAARGFVVFYPNYRGSTGRGVEFSKMGQADAAGKEFDDLLDGIDYLADTGLVNASKVGITGGSYGGYASAWGATYFSDRFAASVMFVGISDNVSKVGTTDIPEEMFLVHHRKRLWDDWDYFLKRSPIHYVQRNRTPTLILHGKEDPRVHPSQSLELHRHLKTLKQAPVRLVLYQGEGHGNRKAAARFDYSLRLLQWMEHYLQGPGGEPPAYNLDYAAALE